MSPLFLHLGLIKSLFKAYTPNLPTHLYTVSRLEDYSLKKPCGSREEAKY